MTKVPPQNLEAEQSVLGGLMIDPAALDRIIDVINENDFYKTAHKKIFSKIKDLKNAGKDVDLITVTAALKDSGDLDNIGGSAYIATLIDVTPSSANIESYAEIVKEKSMLRRLIEVCGEATEKAYAQEFEDTDAFLNETESKIFSVVEKGRNAELTHVKDVVKASLDRLEFLYNNKSDITGVPSGFKDLDRITAGFQPGELIIVAARPSMGKTAFVLNIAQHTVLREKKSVAFFSLEMGQEQLMMRMLGSETKVNLSDLRVGRVPDAIWPKLIEVASKFAEASLYIDDTSGISPYEIKAKARRLKSQKGLDMIVVDYLQIMDLKMKVESRERAIAEMSKNMKQLAKELHIPVVILSQLNRGVEGRNDRRPMLSDLRESGSIEQDADLVMMLYREEYYDKENTEARGKAEVIIGKHRNGGLGVVHLAWLGQYSTFANLAPQDMMPAGPPLVGTPRPFATV